jgi:hypothetical protein
MDNIKELVNNIKFDYFHNIVADDGNKHSEICFGLNGFIHCKNTKNIPSIFYPLFKTFNKFIINSTDLLYLYTIDNKIFNNVSHLEMNHTDVDNPIISKIINSMNQLKYLKIFSNYNNDNDNKIHMQITNLPAMLEALFISGINIDSLDNLPQNLKILSIQNLNNISIDNLPGSLEILFIENKSFNQSVENLPLNLKIFILCSSNFNQTINNLPTSLEYLTLLSISCHYPYKLNYTFEITNLPSKLKIFNIDNNIYDNNETYLLQSGIQINKYEKWDDYHHKYYYDAVEIIRFASNELMEPITNNI